MKKKVKSFFAAALAIVLCLSFAVPSFAAGETSGGQKKEGECGDYGYNVNDDGSTATISFYMGFGGDVTIPGTVDGYKVTAIGKFVFPFDNTLTSITIPDSVTSIADNAFIYCRGLTSVTIGSRVTSIDEWTFWNCENLISITIRGTLKSIGKYAFYGCTKLNDVYYSGSKAQWNTISIAARKDCLTNATIHYGSKKPGLANSITASNVTRTASGKAQTFSLNAKAKGGTLSYSSDSKSVKVDKNGKVTIAKNFAGKAVITIVAKGGNYNTATKKIIITVNPSRVTLSGVKNITGKKLKAVWKKNTTGSGYEVQYSTSGKFTAKTTVSKKVSKNSVTSATYSGLKTGTKYYVRVRAYKGSCFGAWSSVKSVTIKK